MVVCTDWLPPLIAFLIVIGTMNDEMDRKRTKATRSQIIALFFKMLQSELLSDFLNKLTLITSDV